MKKIPGGKRFWILLIVFAFAVIINDNYERKSNAYMCSKCGAWKQTVRISLSGFTFYEKTSIKDSPLTRLWNEYLTGCQHDWVNWYGNYHRSWLFGGTEYGDNFPSSKYPACGLTGKLVLGIRRLKEISARIKALLSIGTKDNYLRWLANGLIMELAFMSEEKYRTLDWTAWWSKNSVFFEIYRDKDIARQVALEHVSDWHSLGADKTMSVLGMTLRDIPSASNRLYMPSTIMPSDN